MTRILRYRWNRTCHSFYGESLEFTFVIGFLCAITFYSISRLIKFCQTFPLILITNIKELSFMATYVVSLSALMRKMCIILLISTTTETLENSLLFYQYDFLLWYATKENSIYIRGEFTRKKCKTAILLYCFHTAGVLRIFMLYNLLGPGTSFYRKSKIIVKRKPNYEIGWFHNGPMIIS